MTDGLHILHFTRIKSSQSSQLNARTSNRILTVSRRVDPKLLSLRTSFTTNLNVSRSAYLFLRVPHAIPIRCNFNVRGDLITHADTFVRWHASRDLRDVIFVSGKSVSPNATTTRLILSRVFSARWKRPGGNAYVCTRNACFTRFPASLWRERFAPEI